MEESPPQPENGRCEECLGKLVFMTRCEAYKCERWVCEHNLVKRMAPVMVDDTCFRRCEKCVKSLETNFCSQKCAYSIVDDYLIRRRYKL